MIIFHHHSQVKLNEIYNLVMGSRYTLKNRLDKIVKFGSQIKLILKGRIKKKTIKKDPTQP